MNKLESNIIMAAIILMDAMIDEYAALDTDRAPKTVNAAQILLSNLQAAGHTFDRRIPSKANNNVKNRRKT